jgi:hypothetical protein
MRAKSMRCLVIKVEMGLPYIHELRKRQRLF